MRFIICADASPSTGAGHVMRVCAVAEELIARGLQVVFLGDITDISWVKEYVGSVGFSSILNTQSGITFDSANDVLIVDSYTIDANSQFVDKANWKQIIVLVDDFTPQIQADLYIHAGAGTSWTVPENIVNTRFLSGTAYIAIRKSLRSVIRESDMESPNGARVILVGGGSDSLEFCKSLAPVLSRFDSKFEATIFVSSTTGLPVDSRFRYLNTGKDFEASLVNTNLVFTTAGTSSWELLSCGLPLGIGVAVNNQYANYEYQTRSGLAAGIGSRSSHGLWEFDEKLIRSLIESVEVRKKFQKKAKEELDNRGVERIVDAILSLPDGKL